nr:hypothetical protein [Eubacteriales bacterium]
MAITPLTFTPETGYKDAVTFPDPATEADAREQIQELHDQTKAYVATLIAELLSVANGKGASQIGVEDSEEKFTVANVEAVLAELNNLLSTHVGETTWEFLPPITRDI